jgi:transcription elongation factor Elf1
MEMKIDCCVSPTEPWKFDIYCPKCNMRTAVDTSIDKGCSTIGSNLILICGHCGYADKVHIFDAEKV